MKPLVCLIFIKIWSSLLVQSQQLIFGDIKKMVKLRPESVSQCTTENQTMTCTIDDHNYQSTDLLFKLNKVLVDQDDVEVVNNRTAHVTIKNITGDMKSISCSVNNTNDITLMESVLMNIYEKPVQVKNLSCLVYDFVRNVTCTWDYGVDYAAIKDTKYPVVTLYIGYLQTHSVREWTFNNLETKMEFRNASYIVLFNQKNNNLTIGLSVKSPCGITVNRTFDGESIVKVEPKPVENLRSIVINSTCIQLSWKYIRTEWMTYLISVSSQWGNRQIYMNHTSSVSNYMVCDLVPGTSYSFNIKVKPLLVPGIWSLQSGTSNKTYEDVPGSSPVMTKGGYSWDREECKDEYRSVNIYWRNIPRVDYHGTLAGIWYSLSDGSEPRLLRDIEAPLSLLLACNRSYRVSFQAKNNVGLSKTPSVMVISSADEDGPRDLLVERSDGDSTVYFDWNQTGNSSNTKSTVFYIEAADCRVINSGQAKWTMFPTGTTSGNLTLPEGKAPENYCFARAVTTLEGSAGFEWSPCIYAKDSVPSRSPEDFSAVSGTEDNSLVLKWSKWLCPVGEPYISEYEVMYCPVEQSLNCSVSPRAVTVRYNREQTSALLTDLNSEIKYKFCIRAVTRKGNVGPWSIPVIGQSVDRSLTTAEIVAIVGGSIFCFILAVAGIVFCIRYAKKKGSRKLAKLKQIEDLNISPDPKEIPEIHSKTDDKSNSNDPPIYPKNSISISKQTDLKLDLCKRQFSTDSGCPDDVSTSPGSSKDSKSPLDRIPEVFTDGYVKADILDIDHHGYVEPQNITVGHAHHGTDSHVDSYVHACDTNTNTPDETPILNSLRNNLVGNHTGSDNKGFTDEYGQGDNRFRAGYLLNKTSTQGLTDTSSLAVKTQKIQEHPYVIRDDSFAKRVEISPEQILFSNCLTSIPCPRSNSDSMLEIEGAEESDLCKDVDTSGYLPISLNPMEIDSHIDDSLETPTKLQFNKQAGIDAPDTISLSTAPIKSSIKPNSGRPVIQSNLHNISDTGGYVSDPAVFPMTSARTNQTRQVYTPNANNQTSMVNDESVNVPSSIDDKDIFTPKLTPGYVSHEVVSNSLDMRTSEVGSAQLSLEDAHLETKSNDNSCLSAPTISNKGESSYVPAPIVNNQTETQTPKSGFLSSPVFNDRAENGYVSAPIIIDRSENGYVSAPILKEQTESGNYSSKIINDQAQNGYVSAPVINDKAENGDVPAPILKEQTENGYVSAPVINDKAENGYVLAPVVNDQAENGYVPEPILKEEAKSGNISSPIINDKAENCYVSAPIIDDQIENGYVSAPIIKEQAENCYVSAPIISDQKENGYVSAPNIKEQAGTQTTESGYVSAPIINNQAEIQTAELDYVSAPTIDDQAQSCYVSSPFLNKQTESGYVLAPIVNDLTESQTAESDYVSAPMINNQTELGYVSAPILSKQTESQTAQSGHEPAPMINNQAGLDYLSTLIEPYKPGDMVQPSCQSCTVLNEPGHLTLPSFHQEFDIPTNGDSQAPMLNQVQPKSITSGYVPHPDVFNEPQKPPLEVSEMGTYHGAKMADPVPKQSRKNQSESHLSNGFGYIPHSALLNQSDDNCGVLGDGPHAFTETVTSSVPDSSIQTLSVQDQDENQLHSVPTCISQTDKHRSSSLVQLQDGSHVLNRDFQPTSGQQNSPYVTMDEVDQYNSGQNTCSDDKGDSGLSSLESSGENNIMSTQ